jgi:hypothetical protein
LPAELVVVADGAPTYVDLQRAAAVGGLTKYFDVNLTQLLTEIPFRDTIEIRILPGAVHAEAIATQAELVERLLDRCLASDRFPEPSGVGDTAEEQLMELARPR